LTAPPSTSCEVDNGCADAALIFFTTGCGELLGDSTGLFRLILPFAAPFATGTNETALSKAAVADCCDHARPGRRKMDCIVPEKVLPVVMLLCWPRSSAMAAQDFAQDNVEGEVQRNTRHYTWPRAMIVVVVLSQRQVVWCLKGCG
jgi:hypothetical protein